MANVPREATKYPNIYRLPTLGDDWFEVRINTPQGKKQKRFQATTTKRKDSLDEALAFQLELRATDDKRPTGEARLWTMDQLATAFFEARVIGKNGLRTEKTHWRSVQPLIGNRKVSSITRRDWDTILANIKNKPQTVNRMRTTYKRMMDKAVEWEAIRDNPMAKRLKESKPIKPTLRQDVIAKVAGYLPDEHRDFFLLAFYLGARRAEVAALRVGDLDISTGVLTISRALERDEDGTLLPKGTKTGTIREFGPARQAIEIIMRRQGLLLKHKSHLNNSDYLFSHDGGKSPWNPDAVTRMVKRTCNALCPTSGCDYAAPRGSWTKADNPYKFCERCHVEMGVKITVQNMRRYSTTVKLQAGINPEWVAKQGGWSNTAVMFANYSGSDETDEGVANGFLESVEFDSRDQPSSDDDNWNNRSAS